MSGLRCRACKTVTLAVREKCPLCGTPFVNRHEKIMGAAGLRQHQVDGLRHRPMEALVDHFMASKKNGTALHMEPAEMERLKAFQADMRRDYPGTMAKLREGAYD